MSEFTTSTSSPEYMTTKTVKVGDFIAHPVGRQGGKVQPEPEAFQQVVSIEQTSTCKVFTLADGSTTKPGNATKLWVAANNDQPGADQPDVEPVEADALDELVDGINTPEDFIDVATGILTGSITVPEGVRAQANEVANDLPPVTVKLVQRTGFQVDAALTYLEPDQASGSTITWYGLDAARLIYRVDAVLSNLSNAEHKGQRVALHSIRRALVKLHNADAGPQTLTGATAEHLLARTPDEDPFDAAYVAPGVPEAPEYHTDPIELAEAAKAEHAELATWQKAGSIGDRPATPNLDELNRQYAAGVTATERKARAKGTNKGGVRSPNAHPRLAAAKAAMKALGNKKADGARSMTDDELTAYMAEARLAHPDTNRTAELEYAYWVENISVGRLRWNGLWDALVAAEDATAAA